MGGEEGREGRRNGREEGRGGMYTLLFSRLGLQMISWKTFTESSKALPKDKK